MHREEAADSVVLKAAELDHLANLFIECVHAQRKSLRQSLIKIRLSKAEQKDLPSDSKH
jgi:hypothetical protein